MKHPADDLTGPERELALATVAEYLDTTVPELPQKYLQLLEMYGRACFDKGERYAHDKDTLVQTPRSQKGSGVFGALNGDIAAQLEPEDPDPDKTPVRRVRARPGRAR
jgi:hypothetical protein